MTGYLQLRDTITDNADGLLYDALQNVHHYGEAVQPRGLPVQEISDYRLTLGDASKGLCTLKSRKANYKLIITEFLQYAAGWGGEPHHADLLCAVAPRYAMFRNPDTRLFDGTYGLRARQQLEMCAEMLQDDPDSRQAVVDIHTCFDTAAAWRKESKDIPCTNLWQFRVRNGLLEMTVYMRSNDVYWGTTHDLGAFTLVQRYMGARLGVPCGRFTLFANSLHLYASVRDEALRSWDTYIDSLRDYRLRNQLLPLDFASHRTFTDSWTQDFRMVLDAACEFYLVETPTQREEARAKWDAKFEAFCEDQLQPPTLLRNLWMGITGRLIVK